MNLCITCQFDTNSVFINYFYYLMRYLEDTFKNYNERKYFLNLNGISIHQCANKKSYQTRY